MKNGFKPVYYIYLFALITVLIVLAGITESQAVDIFALIAAIPGWGFMLFWQKVDNFKNRKFVSFQREMIAKGYYFLGPLRVSRTPEGEPSSIMDTNFLLHTDTHLIGVSGKGKLQTRDDIYYKQVTDSNYTDYVLCYEESSNCFGIFKRDQI